MLTECLHWNKILKTTSLFHWCIFFESDDYIMYSILNMSAYDANLTKIGVVISEIALIKVLRLEIQWYGRGIVMQVVTSTLSEITPALCILWSADSLDLHFQVRAAATSRYACSQCFTTMVTPKVKSYIMHLGDLLPSHCVMSTHPALAFCAQYALCARSAD